MHLPSSAMQNALVGEPHLSTLEQISPQAYIHFILCFGLPAFSTHYEVIQILRQGLKETAAEVPILNSLVVSVVDSKGRETKDVRHEDVAMLSVCYARPVSLQPRDLRWRCF